MYLHFKAKHDCLKKEYALFYLSYSELLNFLTENDFDNTEVEKAKKSMSVFFSSTSVYLRSEISYMEITDQETRTYLESRKEIQMPFDLFQTIALLKQAN